VAAGTGGSFYIADSANNRVRKVDASGTITTVAGTGIPTGSIDGEGGNPADDLGDGSPAAGATLNLPWDVATDLFGNLYVADYNNNRIREIDAAGNITTVAGNGTPAYSGDNGPAASAALHSPSGVTVDGGGNLYIADSANNRVRKVAGSGIITTVAGTGTAGYYGDGGPATNAQLQNPDGVALDADGNLYISDSGNQRIRRVNTLGVITTFAGSGSAGYSGDGGPAASASLNRPRGVALDPGGNLYIADQGNNRIREVALAASPAAVGGVAEYSPTAPGPVATRRDLSTPGRLAFAGAVAAGVLLLAAAGWLVARRRVAG
jgi:sugar lactone lactonase YvrE